MVARIWRPCWGTRRTSRPKMRTTTAEPISPRLEAARAASRRTRARATRRRSQTRRRTRDPTKMKSRNRYGAMLACRDTTPSRQRAACGCCFLFVPRDAAFSRRVRFVERARARNVSAPRVGKCGARCWSRPHTRRFGESPASLPGVSRGRPPARCRLERRPRAPKTRAPSFFASILRILALDWSERDRGEIFSSRSFRRSPRRRRSGEE